MRGTDLTTTFTGEGQPTVFIAVDHFTTECVDINTHARATRFETIEVRRQGLLVFRETSNTTWLIERHGNLPPDQFRRKQLPPVALAA